MALKIRLQRQGRIHHPAYRIVVAESTCRRDGKYVEKLGTYEPQARGNTAPLILDVDRATYWMSVGAKPTETAAHLIRRATKSAATK